MKKLLLTLVGAALSLCASAETYKVDFSSCEGLPTTESPEVSSIEVNNVKLSFTNCKKGSYSGASYLQLSGKNYSSSLDFSAPGTINEFSVVTGDNASVNVTIDVIANDTIVASKKLDTKGSTFTFSIPTENQVADGNITIKVSNKYNAQFKSLTVYTNGTTSGETPETPENPENPETPSVESSLDNPITVAKALEVASALADGQEVEAYTKGIVASITEVSTSFGNATYSIKDAEGTTTFSVFRGYGLDGNKFTSEDELLVGAEVIVYGKLVNYKGNTPQYNTGSKIVSYKAPQTGGEEPEEPETPSIESSLESPITVTAALEFAKTLTTDQQVEAYVKGIVATISDLSTSFGNATYTIKDAEGTETFSIYRGYGLDGNKFTSEDELKVGAEVIVFGKIVNYMGNTPQITNGSKIVSYVAPEEPENPDAPTIGTKDIPYTVAEVVALKPSFTSTGKVWVEGYIAGVYTSGSLNSAVFTTEGIEAKTNLVLAPTAETTDYTICVPVQLPNNSIRENLNLVDNPSNLGKKVLLYGNLTKYFGVCGLKDTSNYEFVNEESSSAELVEVENAPVEYFNLQGVRVANPENGLYIRRQGNSVTKVLVK